MDECRGVLRAIGIEPSGSDEEFFVGRSNAAKGATAGSAATVATS